MKYSRWIFHLCSLHPSLDKADSRTVQNCMQTVHQKRGQASRVHATRSKEELERHSTRLPTAHREAWTVQYTVCKGPPQTSSGERKNEKERGMESTMLDKISCKDGISQTSAKTNINSDDSRHSFPKRRNRFQ